MMDKHSKKPNVCFVLPEVAEMRVHYDKVRDCLRGEDAVKAGREKYLPHPDEDLKQRATPSGRERYRSYLARAVFYNVVSATLTNLVGQVFARPPAYKLPASIADLEDNVDGEGLSLPMQSKKALQKILAYGRSALLIDYPASEGPKTKNELVAENLRPTIKLVDPASIINWRTADFGALRKLVLVVIHEPFASFDDGFEVRRSPQLRILRLDAAGEYVCEIWREQESPSAFKEGVIPKRQFVTHSIFKPRDANGKHLTEIPIVFIGAENNDHHIDMPPLMNLVTLNLAHYRNSADYEESAFIMGQPSLVITGLNEGDDEAARISFGSRSVNTFPEGATATVLSAGSNSMIKEAMENKERQMVALGARLIELRHTQRTAFETSAEENAKSSMLGTMADNVSEAYRKALKIAVGFAPQVGAGEVEFALNTEFDIHRHTPDQVRAAVELWVKGAITFSEMRKTLIDAEMAFEQDPAVAEAEIAAYDRRGVENTINVNTRGITGGAK